MADDIKNEELATRDLNFLWGHTAGGVGGKMAIPEVLKTGSVENLIDGASKVVMTSGERGKLEGISDNATANLPDATLLDRANHTGDQPISTVNGLQAALDARLTQAQRGSANGVAPLDATSKIPSAFLPSFVDDVVEVATLGVLPTTGESGKMYVVLDTNKIYRWAGSTYVEIVGSPGTSDEVIEGSANLYYSDTRVRAAPLTTFSVGADASITGTDSVLEAFGKAQAQVNDVKTRTTNLEGNRLRYDAAQTLSAGQKTQVQTNLGLIPGTHIQPYDAGLQSIAAATVAADQMLYATGADSYGVTSLSAFARTLLDDASATAALTTLGLSNFVKTLMDDADASTFLSTLGFSTFVKTLLDDADAAAFKTTLGLATVATSGSAANLTGVLPNAVLNGSYTNLGSVTMSGQLLINAGSESIRLVSPDATSDPYISFHKTISGVVTRQGYIQHRDGVGTSNGFRMSNDQTGDVLLLNNDDNVNMLQMYDASTALYYKIFHSGNDGDGSGMSADDVDGYHAADLYRDNAAFTTTGDLTISNGSPFIRLQDTTASAYDGRLRLNDNNLYIDGSADGTTYAEVLRFELDTKIGYMTQLFVTSTGEGIRLAAPSAGNDPYISFYAAATRGAYIQYTDGTAETNGFALHNDLTDDKLVLHNTNSINALKFHDNSVGTQDVIHTGNLAFNAVAQFSTSTTSSDTSLPVGAVVLAYSNGVANLNTSYGMYLVSGSSAQYTLNGSAGAAMSGTWRARGLAQYSSGNYIVLMQRTA